MLLYKKYINNLISQIKLIKKGDLLFVMQKIKETNDNCRTVYICGNGGSAANAEHISNDLMLGTNKLKKGFKVNSLTSNFSKISCIANDISYNKIYSHQINITGNKNDLLIVLSGSGNSRNITEVIKSAKRKKIFTIGILGFNGGIAKKLLDYTVHFKINDMQISEDLQLIFFNSIVKELNSK